jgi:hypothetical protein
VNRSDVAALAMARDGAGEMAIDGGEVRKLLGTLWFRGVVTQLSPEWRTRLFDALRTNAEIPNHVIRIGRREARVSELGQAQLRDALTSASLSDPVRQDVDLLVNISGLWGEDALRHVQFREMAAPQPTSAFASLLRGIRPRLSRMD